MNDIDKRIDEMASHKIWLSINGIERATNENSELVIVIPQTILVEHHNKLKQSIKQLMADEFEKMIGEDDLWDKKYPLSIKQDIKSRNHLRIELRQKLEEWKK